MRPPPIAFMLMSLLWPSPGIAQTDFSALTIKPGHYIYVTDLSGIEVGGRLSRLSPSALSIDGYEFKPEPGLKIERLGDSVRNGTLIGMAVGAVSVAVFAGGYCASGSSECPSGAQFVGAVAFQAAFCGAVGALFDWLREGRTVIYDSRAVAKPFVRIAPEVTSHRKALGISLSF